MYLINNENKIPIQDFNRNSELISFSCTDSSFNGEITLYSDDDMRLFTFNTAEYECDTKQTDDNYKFTFYHHKEISLDEAKELKICDSKDKLAHWLSLNPMLYNDGKHYAVTEEKQSLLNGNLASYERAKELGIEYPLKWNSTGDECTPWEYSALVALSLTIAAYVAPKVSKQQELELKIKACTTVDEVNEIEINYD